MNEKQEVKKSIIETENLQKTFYVGKNQIRALRGVNFKVKPADFIVVFGPSGCGKTTLLNIISGIDKPTSGKVLVGGMDIFALDEEKRGLLRAKKMGIIHQMPYWVKSLNVLENVALPLIIKGENRKWALAHALTILKELGINHLARQKPTQLSGGEQQKVGFARSSATNPWIILADEPTGNLDSKAAIEIMKLFKLLNSKHRRTIVLVTHNEKYWQFGNRRIEMEDGLIIKDTNHG